MVMDVDEDVEDEEDVGDTAETTVMRKVSQSGATYLILSNRGNKQCDWPPKPGYQEYIGHRLE